jgi:ATP-dependent Clp protease ATP-binding subunit ClpB
LPDKAIDLVDEACASTRVQLDSRPEAIDRLERKQYQLEVEETALGQEKDDASKRRLSSVRAQLGKIRDELEPLLLQHEDEMKSVNQLRDMQLKLETLKEKAGRAERAGDRSLSADLRFGAIPDVLKTIEALTRAVEEEKAADVDGERLVKDTVDPEKIAEIVARMTNIPVQKLNQSDAQRVLLLGERLKTRVIGQDHAIQSVTDAVLRARSGLNKAGQPLCSALFLGPTGVGKTELAKALATELFDDEKHIVRLDMSEYGEKHSVSRLLGAPPGYVGYDQGGQLTEAVRRNPYCVVLFDEVEKAHPEVWNVLLQVLDDGRLTDGQGKVVDFANSVIIMTSNLGSRHLLESLKNTQKNAHTSSSSSSSEEKADSSKPSIDKRTHALIMQEVRAHFRPEFLNRLDEIIVFNPLSVTMLTSIIHVVLKDLGTRLKEQNIKLEMTPACCDEIIFCSYEPEYGARPLRRWLEKHVVTDLSKLILNGELPRDSLVTVDCRKRKRGSRESLAWDEEDYQPDLRYSVSPLSPEGGGEGDMDVDQASINNNKRAKR